eukprot:TRINITY_DN6104_c0_g6_i1.p1 TRINITY_DN6104_c0_g6~~TRINITY_DN6104_c0_g6_i1.p1  ORF type:complete len:401 (-),score=108.78 TRINITY_DN6104_c0_g6_i1:426-1628(-)
MGQVLSEEVGQGADNHNGEISQHHVSYNSDPGELVDLVVHNEQDDEKQPEEEHVVTQDPVQVNTLAEVDVEDKERRLLDYFYHRLASYYCNRNTANLNSEFPLRDDIASFFHEIYQDAFYDSFRAIRPFFQSDFDAYLPLTWIVDLSFKVVSQFFNDLCDAVIFFPENPELGRDIAREALRSAFSMDNFNHDVFQHKVLADKVLEILEGTHLYESEIIFTLRNYTENLVRIAWLFSVQDERFRISFKEDNLEFDENWDERHPKSNECQFVSSVLWPATVFNGKLHSKFKRIVFTSDHRQFESLFWNIFRPVESKDITVQFETDALAILVVQELRKRIHSWYFSTQPEFDRPVQLDLWAKVLDDLLHKHPSSELCIIRNLCPELVRSFLDEFLTMDERMHH